MSNGTFRVSVAVALSWAVSHAEGRVTLSIRNAFTPATYEFATHRLIPIGALHFRRAVAEYVEHYHSERNHEGLENQLISGRPAIQMISRVRRHSRLGGLLNFYQRAA